MIERDVHHLATRYLESLDHPVSLSVSLMLKYGEWAQIAAKRTDPLHFNSIDDFRGSYLATELLRKYPGLPLLSEKELEDKAIAAFWASEAQCCRSNARLLPYNDDPSSEDVDVRILEFFKNVKRRVGRVLGRLPDDLSVRFGPGATFETRGHRSASNLVLGDKLECGIHLTPSACALRPILDRTAWGRALVRGCSVPSSTQIARGNRFFTVPKDALNLRGACAEPGGNVALQLAVGTEIRERLKLRAGIDLDRGQQIHGEMALLASRDGSYATLDLSSASDTLCRQLVRLCLPAEWASVLEALRSPLTRVDGKWVWLEKFSSMGNGFTFELETLIFWALVQEVSSSTVWVYGDDILVATEDARAARAVLEFSGFSINQRKSFVTSYFRESCGTDAFNGVDLKPFRLKKIPNGPADWYSFHNGIYRTTGVHTPASDWCLDQVPRSVRFGGPIRLGDEVLHERRPVTKSRDGMTFCATLQSFLPKVALEHHTPEIQYALALYGAPSAGLTPRGEAGYRRGWASCS